MLTRGYLSSAAGEKLEPAYMHAQRWGGGFKANVLPDAALFDRCGVVY